jgi:hypothetical protein
MKTKRGLPRRFLARETSAGEALKGVLAIAQKCGVWSIVRLCSQFVSIAEVDKRRSVLAIYE